MDRSKLNLSRFSSDSQDDDLEELLIIKQEEAPKSELPDFNNYGDDSDEVIAMEEDETVQEIKETFNDYGDDSDEVIEMEKEDSGFVEYDVRVKVRRLRYFSGPGTNYVDIGVGIKDSMFTIVEESTGIGAVKWGRLKGYEPAWIPLDHCEKV